MVCGRGSQGLQVKEVRERGAGRILLDHRGVSGQESATAYGLRLRSLQGLPYHLDPLLPGSGLHRVEGERIRYGLVPAELLLLQRTRVPDQDSMRAGSGQRDGNGDGTRRKGFREASLGRQEPGLQTEGIHEDLQGVWCMG